MRLLFLLSKIFINAFGITQPSPEHQQRVSLVLGGFLLAVIVVVLSIIGFLLYELHLGR